MKLKEGYVEFFDEIKSIKHIYPGKGRTHFLDNCWCNPISKGSIVIHNEEMHKINK